MTVLLIILTLLLAVIVYLLVAPFYIEVDSQSNVYQVRFHITATGNFNFTSETILLELMVLGRRWKIDLLRPSAWKEKKDKTKEGHPKKRRRISVNKIRSVLGSFRFTRCRIAVDTGDVQWNGILFPWVWWLGTWSHKDIAINFQDRNEIDLVIRNNFFRMLQSYLLPNKQAK